jgi:hypothetical protein
MGHGTSEPPEFVGLEVPLASFPWDRVDFLEIVR